MIQEMTSVMTFVMITQYRMSLQYTIRSQFDLNSRTLKIWKSFFLDEIEWPVRLQSNKWCKTLHHHGPLDREGWTLECNILYEIELIGRYWHKWYCTTSFFLDSTSNINLLQCCRSYLSIAMFVVSHFHLMVIRGSPRDNKLLVI